MFGQGRTYLGGIAVDGLFSADYQIGRIGKQIVILDDFG